MPNPTVCKLTKATNQPTNPTPKPPPPPRPGRSHRRTFGKSVTAAACGCENTKKTSQTVVYGSYDKFSTAFCLLRPMGQISRTPSHTKQQSIHTTIAAKLHPVVTPLPNSSCKRQNPPYTSRQCPTPPPPNARDKLNGRPLAETQHGLPLLLS